MLRWNKSLEGPVVTEEELKKLGQKAHGRPIWRQEAGGQPVELLVSVSKEGTKLDFLSPEDFRAEQRRRAEVRRSKYLAQKGLRKPRGDHAGINCFF